MVHLTPGAAIPDPDGSCHRVDALVLYDREIDDQAIIAHPQATGIVAATSNGHKHIILTAEVDCGDNVCHIHIPGNQAGPPVDLPRPLSQNGKSD